jgi:hypothetical protein
MYREARFTLAEAVRAVPDILKLRVDRQTRRTADMVGASLSI